MRELTPATGPWLALVVDDDALVRRCLAHFLATGGAEVLTAGNGLEALRLLVSSGVRPDVVFTDLCMPVLGGAALIERMGQVSRLATIPVVVVSASDEPCGRAAAQIAKPFTKRQVLRAAETALGGLVSAAV